MYSNLLFTNNWVLQKLQYPKLEDCIVFWLEHYSITHSNQHTNFVCSKMLIRTNIMFSMFEHTVPVVHFVRSSKLAVQPCGKLGHWCVLLRKTTNAEILTPENK